MTSINNTDSSGYFRHNVGAPDSAAEFEIQIVDANKRTLIKKAISGAVSSTGEEMNPLHVQYEVNGNAGDYQSLGHTIGSRTNVGFNSQMHGTIHGLSSLVDVGNVNGSGSEIAGIFGFVNCFSTGYANANTSIQGMDYTVQGPVGDEMNRPQLLTGHSLCINNFAPAGTINDVKRGAFGFKMASVPGQGAKEGWAGLTTYALHAGFSVSGWSGPYDTAKNGTDASATPSFLKAFHAGGTGGGVMLSNWRSKIVEGFYAEDYTKNAFHATNPHPAFNGAAFLADQGAGYFSYGISAPDAPLHIGVDGTANAIVQSATQNASVKLRRSQGSIAVPSDVTAGGQIGAIEASAYKNGQWCDAGKSVFDIESVGATYVNGVWRISTFVNGAEVTHMRASGLGVLVNLPGQLNGSNAKFQIGNINGGASGIAVGNVVGDVPTNCITFVNKNGTVGSIQTSGAATQYYSTSDYRLKSDVTPIVGALARNSLLRPVAFKWSNGEADEGFIAHELQEVFPSAVVGEKDGVSENGEPLYQQANYQKVIAHLVACVEELRIEIETLKAKNG